MKVLLFAAFVSLGAPAPQTKALYKYTRGSYEYSAEVPLVRSYSNVLPEDLVELVVEEARLAHEWEKSLRGKGLKHGKATTNWAPRKYIDNPRNAVEMAVAVLFRFAFPDGPPAGGLAGGEWWVQKRNRQENIGFHFDKDEGVASEEWWMKMPALSSVTFLSDAGGPTMLANQRTNRGGNEQLPHLPTEGFLVYPKKNRHFLFHGDLLHGVVGELGIGSGDRITLLVNWWDKKPIAPYNVDIDDKTVEKIKAKALRGSGKVASMWADLKARLDAGSVGPSSAGTIREYAEPAKDLEKELATGAALTHRRIDIMSAPTRRYNYPMIENDGLKGKIVGYNWTQDEAHGVMHSLDLRHDMCMRVFGFAGTKVILFRDGTTEEQKAAVDFDMKVAYPVAKAFRKFHQSSEPKIYVANSADKSVQSLAASKYGIRGKAGTKLFPAVAILKINKKEQQRAYKMPEDLPVTAEAIVSWIREVQKGGTEYVVGRKTAKRDEM